MIYKVIICTIIIWLNINLVNCQTPKLYDKDLIEFGEEGIRENVTSRMTKRGDTVLSSIKRWDIEGRLIYYFYNDRDGYSKESYNFYNEKGQLFKVKYHLLGKDIEYKINKTFFYNGKYLSRIIGIDIENDTIINTYYNLESDNNTVIVNAKISYPLDIIEYEINKDGTVRSQKNKSGVKTRFEYDSIGNLIKEIEGSDHLFGYVYNDGNLLIEKNEILDGISYKVVIYEYDSLNRISCLLEKGYKDKIFKIIDYTYNQNGEKISFIFYKRKKRKPDEIFFGKLTKW